MPTASTDAATAASAPATSTREPAAAATPLATPVATLPALAPTVPGAGQRARVHALPESADSLALAELALEARTQRRTMAIVCADALAASRLATEIAWFAPALSISVFPDWETLPYDHFSPHQDLVSERLATLYRITRGECNVVLVAAQTALYRLAPQSFLAAHTFFLTQGEKLDVDALRSQLALAGYTNVTQVVSPGEFSIRGGLIDLYPMGAALPYRLDLFGDEIETSGSCRRASFRSMTRAARVFADASGRCSKAIRRALRSTRTSRRASCPAASSITCRCSSTRRRRSSITFRATRSSGCMATSTPRSRASGRIRSRATG